MNTQRCDRLDSLRIALVAGHFSPEIGYQEVDLARAYGRLGATVTVLTTTAVSKNARSTVAGSSYRPGVSEGDGYTLVRLRPRVVVGANLLGCRTVRVLEPLEPDVVVVVGPGKIFGADVFRSPRARWRRIAIVQENSEDGRSRDPILSRRAARASAHWLVKRRVYRRVVRNGDRIVLNVPESREIITSWLPLKDKAAFERKAKPLRLGFDHEKFYFDAAERVRRRKSLGIAENDELLLCTCTRVTADKGLTEAVTAVSAVRHAGVQLRYIIAGVGDDQAGEELRAHVEAQPEPAAFALLPMLSHAEMRGVFSAADLGYWPRAAISIQQAMGTGLPVILRQSRTVEHLLVGDAGGWYVPPNTPLVDALTQAAWSLVRRPRAPEARTALVAANMRYLSYDALALEILEGLVRPLVADG